MISVGERADVSSDRESPSGSVSSDTDVLTRASALVDKGRRVFKGDLPYNIAQEIFRSNVKFVHESHVFCPEYVPRMHSIPLCCLFLTG